MVKKSIAGTQLVDSDCVLVCIFYVFVLRLRLRKLYMYYLLLRYWKSKFKWIDDINLFKVILWIFTALFITIFSLLEIICVKKMDVFMLGILLTMCIQYNKHVVIMNISNRRKDSFYVAQKTTWLKFCFFQLLKENFIAPITAVITVMLSVVALFINPLSFLMLWSVLMVEILWFYISYKDAMRKKYGNRAKYKKRVTIQNQARKSMIFSLWRIRQINSYKNTLMNASIQRIFLMNLLGSEQLQKRKDFKISSAILHSNVSYFVRLPLREYIELLVQVIALMICIYFNVSVIAVNYFMIVFFVVDIELLGDKNMGIYNVSYGKFGLKYVAGVKHIDRYRLSDEYKVFLKYLFIEVVLILYGGPLLLGFIILLYTVSYRYFCGLEKVFKERKLFKNTMFRMCMFYYILFSIAPFLFEKELYKIFAGYEPIYGILFLIVLSCIMLFVPIENIIDVSGEKVDDE